MNPANFFNNGGKMQNTEKMKLFFSAIKVIIVLFLYIPFLGFSLFYAVLHIDDMCMFLQFSGVSPISHTPCISRVATLAFDILIAVLNLLIISIFLSSLFKKLQYDPENPSKKTFF